MLKTFIENLSAWDTRMNRIKSMPLNISGRGYTYHKRGAGNDGPEQIHCYGARTEVI